MACATSEQDGSLSVTSTMTQRRYVADPALVASRGRYYLFPTINGTVGWSSKAFEVFESEDLVHWHAHGEVLRLGTNVAWAST